MPQSKGILSDIAIKVDTDKFFNHCLQWVNDLFVLKGNVEFLYEHRFYLGILKYCTQRSISLK